MSCLLSFIVPLYNTPNYVVRCINSLLQSPLSAEEYEIVVVNDGSTDESRDVIVRLQEEHPNAPIRLFDQENRGIGGARNRGMELAQGDYVWFIDADDFVFSEQINRIVSLLREKNPQILLFEFEHEMAHSEETPPRVPHLSLQDGAYNAIDFFVHYLDINYITVWRFVFSRKFLRDNDLRFAEDIFYEDMPFVYQAFVAVDPLRFVYCSAPVYRYFVHSSSVIRSPEQLRKRLYDRVLSSRLVVGAAQKAPSQAMAHKILQQVCNHLISLLNVGANVLSREEQKALRHFVCQGRLPHLVAVPPIRRKFLLYLSQNCYPLFALWAHFFPVSM